MRAMMDAPPQTKSTHSWAWRSDPAVWLCVALASVVLIGLAVGIGADVTALGRWMGGICGEWAPPSAKNDPRCDGRSLLSWRVAGYSTAKWSGGGLCLAGVWLMVRKKRAGRAARPREKDAG